MFRNANSNASKILAGFLAALMLVSMIPVGVVMQVFAAEVEAFTVKLPAGVSATVTVTDDNDAEKVFTADTNENFEAVFENLLDETTYTVAVSAMELYKSFTKENVVASAEAPLEILAGDLVEKDVQTVAFAEESISKVFGDHAFATVLSEAGAGTGARVYSSTNENVATVGPDGVVSIVGAGTTEIKVSVAADDNYKAAEDTVILTVEQAENAISYSANVVEWMYNDIKQNELTVMQGAVGQITYESSDDTVARVDAATGEVTVLKPGSAKITATFVAEEGSCYKDSSASYEITAVKKTDALHYDNQEITVTYGDEKGTNPLTKPENITGKLTYSSDNKDAVAVDEKTGEYTIVGAGTAKITATLADDENYDNTEASFVITVQKKADAISFDKEKIEATYGDEKGSNALEIPKDITGKITYSTDNKKVAAVDEKTGEYTIVGTGTVKITATLAGDKNYDDCTVSYEITVAKKTIKFTINETVDYGCDDPDLSGKIMDGVTDGLIDAEKKDFKTLTRVLSRISYSYPLKASDKLRAVGKYEISFTTIEDASYEFELDGTLEVVNKFDASELYEISGLNEDGWIKAGEKVVISVKDKDNYRIGTSCDNAGEWTETELVLDTEEGFAKHTFYIRDVNAKEGKQKVSLPVTIDFGVDGTAPVITEISFEVKGEDTMSKVIYYLSFGIFCNERVEATVKADDVEPTSGIDTITLYCNDSQYGDAVKVDKENSARFILSVEDFEAMKSVAAIAFDKVGNKSELTYNEDCVQLETNEPVLEITFADATSLNGEEKWYGGDIDFNVTVSDKGEKNSGIRAIYATINGTRVDIGAFADAEGNVLEPFSNENVVVSGKDSYYFIGEKTEIVCFTINTALVEAPAMPDGKYTVVITAVDNAGNEKESDEAVIYIDREEPIVTGFEFKAAGSVDGNGKPVTTVESYGYFFTEDTEVVVTAKDARPSAGIQYIEFFTVSKNGENTHYVPSRELKDSSDDSTVIVSASFTVPKGFKGQVYARAVDKVEHTTVNEEDGTPKFFNPNGTVIEDADMHKTHSEATVTLVDEAPYTDRNNLPLYKWSEKDSEGIPVKLYVKDSFSGIRNVTWKVTAPFNATENDPAGTVSVGIYLDGAVAVGDVIDGWTVEAVDNNLVTEMSRIIYVKNNSNAIAVDLSFNDRALNSTEAKTLTFSIDNTIPVIEVVYDNNTPDVEYTDFYKENRVATVTVTERNFRAKDVVFAITNTDGIIPAVDLTSDAAWKIVENDDPDKTLHVATFEYGADGDYTFDISYKDNAENEAEPFAQHKFTIDKTLPTVSVVYDNMASSNGNYYDDDRTATITITEHNFDPARVTVIGVATDNGAASTFPAISTWRDNGDDTHTAAISYTADSKYSFDIEFFDMANNSIEDYTPEEFYVDKTAPALSITGVADKSANNGDVAPVITYSDTNFDKNAVTITLSGINSGNGLEYEGSFAQIANGQIFTYADFERIQSVDDIYVLKAKLTDKAGNKSEESITFSVNRFGSVYNLSGLEEILTKYLQSEEDIVFTETNVDSLDREVTKIKLTKNGTPSDLVEGTDFTVDVQGGNGEWSVYTYTIKKALFADDGRYSIAIYSKDAAGNVNENIDEAKAAEISFGIDKTNPVIVPIDLESGVQYAVEKKTASIEIKDNLVLEGVKIYLNGREVEYTVDGETYTFEISKSYTKQNVKIVAVDAAGNEEPLEIEDFLVNANLFVRLYNNTPLFIGAAVGIVVIALAIAALIVFGKKKK